MDNKETKKPRQSRKRARNVNGSFKGDDPTTTANDAWQPMELPLKKDNPYKVKQRVKGQSAALESAGKYAKKPKTRPTFGNVKSIQH